MYRCFHSPLISLRQASTAAVWRCNKITRRSSSLYKVCDLSGEMSSDWSCGTNTSLMRLQSHRRATSWRRCEVRRVGGVRSVPFWCEILLRLLLHVGPHSRIENNEKMSCNCAALRSAFDLLFSSFLPLRLVFDSCFRFVVLRRVSGAFAQPRLWTGCNYPKPFISDGSYRLMTFLFKRFQRLWLGSSKRFVS